MLQTNATTQQNNYHLTERTTTYIPRRPCLGGSYDCLDTKDCLVLRLPVGKIGGTVHGMEQGNRVENMETESKNQVPHVRVQDLENNKVGLFKTFCFYQISFSSGAVDHRLWPNQSQNDN